VIRDNHEVVPFDLTLMTIDVHVNVNSSYIQSFAVDKLYCGSGAKTLATPVDSLGNGFDVEAYRQRPMAVILGTTW